MRKAKIVATLGPAVASYSTTLELVRAGVDIFRMNMSHGTREAHETAFYNVRRASAETGRTVGIFADLQGPKIRLGRFEAGPYELNKGEIFTITTEDLLGSQEISSTTFAGLPENVSVGDILLVDDGRVVLKAIENDGVRITCVVEVGGKVSNNKGINLPRVAVNISALCDKDVADLRWALRLGVDMMALSFVRSTQDIEPVQRVMEEEGVVVPVIAKIEKPQAVENIREISLAFDGIMVARGDLGVELPLEEVPIVQKRIISVARKNAKPVIVATQMLESMISCPRPTRAEASDVANAVLDGADAMMLSGETSVGDWPVLTVSTMAEIISATEAQGLQLIPELAAQPKTVGGAVCWAAVSVAELLDAKYLCVFSESGDSIRRVSRLRHQIPVMGFSPVEQVVRQVALSWGVSCHLVERFTNTDQMMGQVDEILISSGVAEVGDRVVILSGSPVGVPGTTNHMRLHVVGTMH